MVLILAGLFLAIPVKNTKAASAQQLVGVWHIATQRAGSVLRPATLTFSADGNMGYTSGSVINRTEDPTNLNKAHFFGRSGGQGVYAKVPGSANEFVAQTEELLYDENGNVGGRFLVTFNITLNKGQAGASETINVTFTFVITEFEFNGGVGDPLQDPLLPITGERVVTSDAGIPGNAFGYRLIENCYLKGASSNCYLGPIDINKQ